jgi:hypothetical protein
VRLNDWFLTAGERGNAATEIDRLRSGNAWTDGQPRQVFVDGAENFAGLYDERSRPTTRNTPRAKRKLIGRFNADDLLRRGRALVAWAPSKHPIG